MQNKGLNRDEFKVLLKPDNAARNIFWSTIPPARNSRSLNTTRSSPPLRRNPGEPPGQWRTGSEKCSNTFQKNGFLFSREELSFWQKCQLSSIQNNHKCSGTKLIRVKQENPKSWNTNLGKVPIQNTIAGKSAFRRLRQPASSMAEPNSQSRALISQGREPNFCRKTTSFPLPKQWQNSFSAGKDHRPGRPQSGSEKPVNGKGCHGTSPCWASSTTGVTKPATEWPQGPFFKRLRQSLPWWEQNTRNPEVLGLIKHGVPASYPLPSRLSKGKCIRSQEETILAWETIQEYLEVGAIKEILLHQAKHLIPWFVIKRGEKLRLITNCKEINQYLEPKPFRLENWAEIFPYLRKGMWAAKIDLKHAYFHLEIAEALKPYICIQIEEKCFQFQAACFGMSTLPQQWQSVMKVFLKKNGESKVF